jgi:ATP-dependent protease ClpP protease subunit
MEEELMLLEQQMNPNRLIRTIPIQLNSHLVFIDNDIGSPEMYRDVIHCIATCSENDDVTFLINSNGGRTDSIWQIIEAVKGCRGDVGAAVIGSAYSAASMLACMVPDCTIADSAEFMLHTAHYGSIGTVPNVKGQTDFATRQINKLLDICYTGFLTPKELDELKNGKEFWFDADESRDRMLKRHIYLLKQTKQPRKRTAKKE